MEVGDCQWDRNNLEAGAPINYPRHSDDKHATHLAERFHQGYTLREERIAVPSENKVRTKIGEGGVIFCYDCLAFSVAEHKYDTWRVRLYNFKRRGKVRKVVGWSLLGAGTAVSVLVPGGVLLHAWTLSALPSLLASVGTGAATAAGAAGNGMQGVRTGLKIVGEPVGELVPEPERRPLAKDPESAARFVWEPQPPRICKASSDDHEPCRG